MLTGAGAQSHLDNSLLDLGTNMMNPAAQQLDNSLLGPLGGNDLSTSKQMLDSSILKVDGATMLQGADMNRSLMGIDGHL